MSKIITESYIKYRNYEIISYSLKCGIEARLNTCTKLLKHIKIVLAESDPAELGGATELVSGEIQKYLSEIISMNEMYAEQCKVADSAYAEYAKIQEDLRARDNCGCCNGTDR